jgi:hypothetical protein
MLNLSEIEKTTIISTINENCAAIISQYPIIKYPDEPYFEWLTTFQTPNEVLPEQIQKALEWKYGCWGKRTSIADQKVIISKCQKYWTEFCSTGIVELEPFFAFWEAKLGKKNTFFPISFIAHLMFPNIAEHVSSTSFKSMCKLMQSVRPEWNHSNKLTNVEDILLYTEFVRDIFSLCSFEVDPMRQLDKYLTLFMESESINTPKIEKSNNLPMITHFIWSEITSTLFDLEKIVLRANADVLFACLLKSLESSQGYTATMPLKISEIMERIPLGSAGISNAGSYNYAVLALFATQKGRDYFIFSDPELQKAFTTQANNSSRDMLFWKKNLDAQVTIHSKYFETVKE